MDEIQLGLGARDARRGRQAVVVLAVVFAVASAAAWWLPQRGTNHPDPGRGIAVTGLAALWLLVLAYVINQARGRTRLTSDGLRLESCVKRRSIPWADVIRFEERQRSNRGGRYWDVRVHRKRGRPLTMPGLFTSSRKDHDFEGNLLKLCLYWSEVKGGGPSS